MGIIKTSTTDVTGKKIETKVITNKLEDFVIWVVSRFGRKLEWRAVHRFEKRKLRKAARNSPA